MDPVLCNFMFCNRITAEKGKYTLEGIFYRIHAAVYPCTHRCYVVVGWYGQGGGSHVFGIRFLSPDRGRALIEIPAYPFRLTSRAPYFNGVIEISLPLEGEGVYWFEVMLNGRVHGYFPVHVETVLTGMGPPS